MHANQKKENPKKAVSTLHKQNKNANTNTPTKPTSLDKAGEK